MIKKVQRKVFLQQQPLFPQTNYYRNKYFYPESYDNYIFYVEGGSTTGICNNLSRSIVSLANNFGFKHLSFLGDTTTPWLYRDHDYPPVKKSLNYLVENKISKSFNGAIQVDVNDLSEFLKHLFWLVRCNGVVFYPYFSDAGSNIMAFICKYGNLHVSTLNEQSDISFNEVLKCTGLQYLESNSCGGGKIPGRTIAI